MAGIHNIRANSLWAWETKMRGILAAAGVPHFAGVSADSWTLSVDHAHYDEARALLHRDPELRRFLARDRPGDAR